MDRIRITLFSVLVLLFSSAFHASAQTVEVKGVVWDSVLNEPLIGATATVLGQKTGTVTDLQGQFSISAEVGQTIVFSYLGYADEVLKAADGMNNIRIVLSPDSQLLEETVVVGYGRQKKASSVGSIGTAKGEDLLKAGGVNSVSEALQGQMAGVMSVNTSSKPGDDAASLFIRGRATWGASNPLVLVDGIERNFNDVDINEIESISVLKDASATAVYGVKGANGVILLTTKRGEVKKTIVSFSASCGIKQPTVRYDWADYLTSMKLYNEAAANDKQWDKIIPESTISAWNNAFETGNYGPYNDYFPQVDWWDTLVAKCGFQQNYNVNVRGGSDKVRYFVSFAYLQDGDIFNVQKQAEFDPRFWFRRYNWRTNLDFKITKTTKLSLSVAGNNGTRNQPGFRDAQAGDFYIFSPLITAPSNVFPIKYSDGHWGSDVSGDNNIYAQINGQGQRKYATYQGFYDLSLNQDLSFLTKGLSAKASISYTSTHVSQSSIFKAGIYGADATSASKNALIRYNRTYDYSSPMIAPDGTVTYPMLTETVFPTKQMESDRPTAATNDSFSSYTRRLYYEVALNYDRAFNDHNVTAMAVFNRTITDSAAGTTMQFPAYEEAWVGRATYNWKERYLVEVNAAYTGSEKFARGKRFGFFPSFSVGWRMTEEPFMAGVKATWLNNLKFRYSYGKVGSDRGALRFNYIQLFTTEGNRVFGLNENVVYGPLYHEGELAYEDATWETAAKQNLGMEATLFKRLRVTLDLYSEKRNGILMERNTVAPWMGTKLPSVNIGKTKNHGLDLTLDYADDIGKNFSYFAKFNFATSENRIVFKDDPNKLDDYLKAAGKPIGYQNKYIVAGNLSSIDDIFNYTSSTLTNGKQPNLVPGDLMYIDYNADGVIDEKDKAPAKGVTYPLTTYSLTLGVSWKGLSVSAMLYAATQVFKEQIPAFLWDFPGSNVKAQPNAMSRWTEANASSSVVTRPSVHLTNDYNSVPSTYSYINHSFFRLKNVELSYSFPKQIIKKTKISNLQFYLNGNNLLTFSKTDKRRDPETASQSVYPIIKRYNLGARISF